MNSNLFLCQRLPGRLDVAQTAVLLGFADHDIPVLVRAKLLKPLGNPAPNAPKYFAAVEIEKVMTDKDWLEKATKVISRHWKEKNLRKADAILADQGCQ